MVDYEGVIGLEVHAQLLTESKVFCTCPAAFGAEPNSQTCPICLGLPGVLPVLNERAVELAVKTALALNCQVNRMSRFARKNYFYPDLPKGYQISMYEQPLAVKGFLNIDTEGGQKRVGIVRVHMEEDAGKLLHSTTPAEGGNYSYVDLNRATVPLMEIVSEPDLSTPEEAADYLRKLRTILQYLEVCDGNMEEGSFRCDANVSVRPVGEIRLGTKAEVKNMNSFKHVERALNFEIKRQIELIKSGGQVVQETRLWDAGQAITISMRSKEEAHDYRYFPEPDLPPLVISEEMIERARASLPELPDEKRERFVNEYGIPAYDAGVLTSSKGLADYYEEAVRLFPEPKVVSNWVMTEMLALLNRQDIRITPGTGSLGLTGFAPTRLAAILTMVKEGTLNAATAKEVIQEVFESNKEPEDIVTERGLKQLSDPGEVEKIIEAVLSENAAELKAYKGGKAKLFGFFVGEVMKKSQGKANPKVVNEILKKRLAQ